MTRVLNAPLSYTEAVAVALVLVEALCADHLCTWPADQQHGAILLADDVMKTHVLPILQADAQMAELVGRLLDMSRVANRIRHRNLTERVHL